MAPSGINVTFHDERRDEVMFEYYFGRLIASDLSKLKLHLIHLHPTLDIIIDLYFFAFFS